jgi:endonuclease/exonuclease/phosphatase (EEP) superfamily protein YafD
VIINTHILANFMGDWERHGSYARVEEKQLKQLATMVRGQPMNSLILVVGDFNVPRQGMLYSDFLANSGLADPLAGDSRPTLRAPVKIPSRYSLAIDYALYRLPGDRRLKVECDLWASGDLSDHDGIEIQITAN